jgi:septal ring factor EnvC (AmiA/AmiB activator)
MDREERIAQLQAEVEEHRASIAEREAARERGEYVEREGHGLQYRTQENTAPELPTYVQLYHDADNPEHKFLVHDIDAHNEFNRKGWDEWVQAHIKNSLANERTEVLDQVARTVAEFTSQYVFQKLQPLTRELGVLRNENAEIKRALGEAVSRFSKLEDDARALAHQLESESRQHDVQVHKFEVSVAELRGRLSAFLKDYVV